MTTQILLGASLSDWYASSTLGYNYGFRVILRTKDIGPTVAKIHYINNEGPYPRGLQSTLSHRQGHLRKGPAGQKQTGQASLRYEGPKKEIHPLEKSGEEHHDREKYPQLA
jgi:hypothetical protein